MARPSAQTSPTSLRSTPPTAAATPADAPANPPGAGRDRGFKFLGIAVAVFLGCSVVQALGGSHMFTNTYSDPDSLFLDLLMQVTWWPGWLATAYFALFGAAMIYTDRKLV